MAEYLNTPAEVAAVGVRLGCMGEAGHDEYQRRASETAIRRPMLALCIWFKPGAHFLSEAAYPITASEWDDFLADVPRYCEREPEVWVVDGERYVLPI
jgi:hypothetical protein